MQQKTIVHDVTEDDVIVMQQNSNVRDALPESRCKTTKQKASGINNIVQTKYLDLLLF